MINSVFCCFSKTFYESSVLFPELVPPTVLALLTIRPSELAAAGVSRLSGRRCSIDRGSEVTLVSVKELIKLVDVC